MHKTFFLFVALVMYCSISDLQAQGDEWMEFSGRVIDKESGEPLEGASVFFENHAHIGGFTDKDGNFKVRIPVTLENDVLVVSFLGFEKKYIPLGAMNFSNVNSIALERSVIVLNEIVVIDEGKKLRQIVLRAVEKIPTNYPVERHLIEGLYRKVSTEGASYTHLEEAAITIEDYDYKKPVSSLKIRINAFRQTPDFGKIDSLQLKMNQSARESAATKFQVASNPLFRTYEGNFLRLYKNDGNTFNIKTLSSLIEKHYEFRVLGFETVEKDTILQIAFSEGMTPSDPSGNNYFKVNMSDQAIVEFQFSGSLNGRLIHHSLVKFRKYGARYYPSFIKVTQPRFINRNVNFDEYDISTYWFDEVKLGKFEKISAKNSSDRFEYNYGTSAKLYDPKFWISYKPLAMHPLDPHIKNSLERNGSLEKQFLTK